MTKTFTQNDVIRFIYGEVSAEEHQEISHALICDTELADFYAEIADVKRSISKSRKEPSDRVVSSILAYSRANNLQTV